MEGEYILKRKDKVTRFVLFKDVADEELKAVEFVVQSDGTCAVYNHESFKMKDDGTVMWRRLGPEPLSFVATPNAKGKLASAAAKSSSFTASEKEAVHFLFERDLAQ